MCTYYFKEFDSFYRAETCGQPCREWCKLNFLSKQITICLAKDDSLHQNFPLSQNIYSLGNIPYESVTLKMPKCNKPKKDNGVIKLLSNQITSLLIEATHLSKWNNEIGHLLNMICNELNYLCKEQNMILRVL